MPLKIEHPEFLSMAWTTPVVALLSIAAVLLWVGLHWGLAKFARQNRSWPWIVAGIFLGSLIGTMGLWLTANFASRIILITTSWSIFGICGLTALGVEVILALYKFEQSFVGEKISPWLTRLRAAMILALGAILLQPIFAWNFSRVDEKYIAILVDDSQSMQIVDQQLTDSEKLRLIQVFDPSIAKPLYDLSSASSDLITQSEVLATLATQVKKKLGSRGKDQGNSQGKNELVSQRSELEKGIGESQESATLSSQKIDDLLRVESKLKPEYVDLAGELKSRLSQAISKLVDAAQIMGGDPNLDSQYGSISDRMQAASRDMRWTGNAIERLQNEADRAFFANLPAEKKKSANAILSRTRSDIARSLLTGDKESVAGLIDKIRDGYELKIFRFNRDFSEMDAEKWTEDSSPSDRLNEVKFQENSQDDSAQTPGAEIQSAKLNSNSLQQNIESVDDQQKVTDIAGALERVRKEIPREQLAGVLLVTDGRHNGQAGMESIVRKLGNQEAPVSALVIGSSRPPVDAAISNIEFPTTVSVGDIVPVKIKVNLNGLKDRDVRAKLLDGDKVVQEKVVRVKLDQLATTVELDFEPKDEGTKNLRVEIEPVDADEKEGEAFAENNSREITIAASDNRTEILIIDGRPRWEFGFLRNIFASRDSTAQLQTVLAEPDRLAKPSKRKPVHASAAREAYEIEAELLPKNEAEWMKFDVIVLGDIPKNFLSSEQIAILKKFVNQRSGTLIVIAGANAMPHRYMDTELAEVLPVKVDATEQILFTSPETSFRFELSQVGWRHTIMRQGETREEGKRVWSEIPQLYWRHPITEVKPGATILAYAQTDQIQQQLSALPSDTRGAIETRQQRRQQIEKENALVVTQRFGGGKVLMMNTDRTWRFRYRVGDPYHHRFWGQILRWATAEKLQGGTEYVQIGSDKPTYQVDEPIIVSAKITDSYYAAINDLDAKIKVYRAGKLILNKSLGEPENSNGSFRVDLGKMPSAGQYRVELDSPAAQKIFAGSNVGKIESRFVIKKPEVQSAELINTTADRVGLRKLTAMSGGTMVEADGRFEVVDYFAEGTKRYIEQKRFSLWDSWPMLILMIGLVATEWVLRKKGGLV